MQVGNWFKNRRQRDRAAAAKNKQNVIGVELKKTGGSEGSDSEDENEFDDSMTDSPSPVDEPKDLSLRPSFSDHITPPFPLNSLFLFNPAFLQMQQQLANQFPISNVSVTSPTIPVPPKRNKLSIEEILDLKTDGPKETLSPHSFSPSESSHKERSSSPSSPEVKNPPDPPKPCIIKNEPQDDQLVVQ
uniref:Homeobox domain-containing protein n=1 Tax=Heterorhabditis bacteriophora TaxID=37862 RepID=A0A1I7XET0_HETBA